MGIACRRAQVLLLYFRQIAQCGAIPILVKMLQNAKGEEEKLSACNTLWTLAFDGDNKKEINNDDYAIFELKKLLTSENGQIKRAAAGALWECEGKEKYAEEKQQSDTLQPATGAHARDSDTRTLINNELAPYWTRCDVTCRVKNLYYG